MRHVAPATDDNQQQRGDDRQINLLVKIAHAGCLILRLGEYIARTTNGEHPARLARVFLDGGADAQICTSIERSKASSGSLFIDPMIASRDITRPACCASNNSRAN